MNRFLKIRIKEEDIKKIDFFIKENNCEKLLGLSNLELIEI